MEMDNGNGNAAVLDAPATGAPEAGAPNAEAPATLTVQEEAAKAAEAAKVASEAAKAATAAKKAAEAKVQAQAASVMGARDKAEAHAIEYAEALRIDAERDSLKAAEAFNAAKTAAEKEAAKKFLASTLEADIFNDVHELNVKSAYLLRMTSGRMASLGGKVVKLVNAGHFKSASAAIEALETRYLVMGKKLDVKMLRKGVKAHDKRKRANKADCFQEWADSESDAEGDRILAKAEGKAINARATRTALQRAQSAIDGLTTLAEITAIEATLAAMKAKIS